MGRRPRRSAFADHHVRTVTNAPRLKTAPVPLNSGLVGIIGARGSGKTALADIIAAGGFALSAHLNERSFIRRARQYLDESAAARLAWEDGDLTANELQHVEAEDFLDSPRVQYLSQQFVDTLCSAEGVTDELLAEVERVIYQSHPPEDRMGTTSFRELLDLRAARGQTIRQSHEDALRGTAQELNVERERRASLQGLQKQRAEKLGSIAKDKRDRSTLMGKGSQERAKQFDTVSVAAEAVRFQVEQARRRLQALFALKDEVADTRTNKTPMRLRQLQQTHSEAGLSAENWKAFALDFVGGVDGILAEGIKTIEGRIRGLTGPTPGEAVADASTSTTSLLPDGAELGKQTLSLLDKELARLRALMGVDAENAKAFARLSEKISRDEAALAKLERDIEAAGRLRNGLSTDPVAAGQLRCGV